MVARCAVHPHPWVQIYHNCLDIIYSQKLYQFLTAQRTKAQYITSSPARNFFKNFFRLAARAYYTVRPTVRGGVVRTPKATRVNVFLFLWGLTQPEHMKTTRTRYIRSIYKFYMHSSRHVASAI